MSNDRGLRRVKTQEMFWPEQVREGYFHCFSLSIPKQRHDGNYFQVPIAIIELDNGRIVETLYSNVTFIDAKLEKEKTCQD